MKSTTNQLTQSWSLETTELNKTQQQTLLPIKAGILHGHGLLTRMQHKASIKEYLYVHNVNYQHPQSKNTFAVHMSEQLFHHVNGIMLQYQSSPAEEVLLLPHSPQINYTLQPSSSCI